MANRNNSGRTKKFRSYKPYDTSNSFVKRLITDVLPQNSWISRWLSPASNVANVRAAEIEDDEDEEEERQPPSKKIRYENATPGGADYSHQNNVNRLGNDDGDLSPILSSRIADDGAVAGPSGLHLRRPEPKLVSSTPAFSQPPPPPSHSQEPDIGRARGAGSREDAEDGSGSDSTSGCSSLVPQTERPSPYATPFPPRRVQLTPRAQITPKPYSNTPRSSSDESRRLQQSSTMRSLNSSRSELNTSKGLSFDPYVFVNPLNKSLTGRTSLNDSCFYRGRTMFGGSAAAFSHNSLLGAMDTPPQVVTVKPAVSPQRDTIGASAQRILRALEQFSTPVLDARRVPASKTEVQRKRKAPPFEELIIPSMPTLLRIKRREVGRSSGATPSSSPAMVASVSSSAAMTVSRASQPPAPAAPSTSFSCVFSAPSTSAASLPSTSSSIPSHYSIREDSSKDKHVGSIKGRKKDEVLELERVEVNLPSIALPISSLPKIDLGLPKAQHSSDPLTKAPAKPKQDNSSSEDATSARHLFKFSEPDHAPVTQANIISDLKVSPFTFSQPLPPQTLEKGGKNESSSMTKTSETQQPQIPLMKLPTPNYKLKRKTKVEIKEEPSLPAVGVKPPNEFKCGSVMDFFSQNSTMTTTTSLKDKFKPPADSWKCSVCLVNNDKEKTKCAACETPKENKKKEVVRENSLSSGTSGQTFKGFEGFKKPADTWECKECLVRNKNSDLSCVACSTSRKDKPKADNSSGSLGSSSKPAGSTSLTGPAPLLNSFIKKPSGSWECDTCLVSNKADTTTCIACSTPKPGTPNVKQKPTFSFGLPSDAPTTRFQFGIPPSSTSTTESQPSVPKITFGFPSDDEKQSSTSATFKFGATDSKPAAEPPKTFTFGNMQQTKDKETEATKLTVPNTFTFGIVETSNKEEPQKKDEDMPPSKKRVSFGNPITTEKIFTSDSNSSSHQFGNTAKTTSATSTDSSNFLFTPKTPLFGETGTTVTSGKETAPVSNNLFTFGKSESSKLESQPTITEAPKPEGQNNGLFGFPPSSGSGQAPPSIDNKVASPFTSDKPSKVFNATTSVVAKPSFTFGAVATDSSNTSVPKDTPLVNNIFSNTNSETVFNAGKSDEKKSMFFNEQSSENKPSFFNSNADSKNIFGGNKIEEWPQKASFGSGGSNSGFESKVSQAPAPFGSAVTAPNSVENKVFSFNAVATTQQNNPASFSFSKNAETTVSKPQPPSTGFSFLGSSQSTGGQQAGIGGFSFTAAAPAAAPTFGAAPTSATTVAPFGQQQAAPVFSPPEQKPFVFGGAQSQPQQAGVFSFSAPITQTTAASGPVAPSPTFGVFNAPSTEPAPTMFDPNLKPSFNFTGGATPSFSASSGATPPTLMSENGERKRVLRRAVRRTTQNR